MNFPPQTPAAVRTAVTAYADRHKAVTLGALAGFSIATVLLLTLASLLTDRFVEMPVLVRAAGLLLVLVTAAICLPLILRALLRREPPRAIAIRLDAALPQNQDRWATALELSSPASTATQPASPELVARLLRETDANTTPAAATTIVPTRTLKRGLVFLALVLAALALVATNSHFNFRLLMQRFLNPWANLPRDSTTQVHFLNVNQHTAENGRVPAAAWRVLENDVFALSIALARRNQTTNTTASAAVPAPTPRLEILRPDGRLISQDFLHAGRAWTFSLGALTDDVTFRIRAGDALTETFRVAVQPRIRITTVRHTVRFPGYARLAEIKAQPLKGDRLSLLEDAQIDFEVDCDQPIRDLTASFELLDKSRGDDAPAAKSAREAVAAQRIAGTTGQPEKKPDAPRTRSLPVKIRQNNQATLRLKLDQPGLLRLRVTGENGLTGIERVIVVEPVRDTPPRLTVSGLEPDTYIVPGETLAFQYTVEDDLGVSDVIMDWAVAGSARTGNLAGEEALATPAAGQKQLTGQRLLQRMNYYVYGGSPMEITLIAVDSKGQEVRSPTYRIFLESDSFATRFANGLTFLRSVQAQANQHGGHVGGLFNQTKILEAAAGSSRTWPAAQSNLLARFLEQSATRPAPAQQLYVEQYHGGWPQRLLESTALALSLRRALVGHPDVPAAGPRLRDTQDLPAALTETRALLTNQVRLASLWRAGIDAETRRFAPETLLQKLRGIRLRLARSEAQTQKANAEVQTANLEFYQNETKAIITNARGLDPLVAARFTNDVAALEAALAAKETAPLLQRLTQFERALAAHAPPASDELQTAVAEIAQHARTNAPAKRQFLHALADLLTLRESEAGTAPLDDLKLCRAWLTDTVPAPAALLTAPAEPLDLWLLTERLLRDWRTLLLDVELRRFALQPDQQDDAEAGLREQALALADRLARGVSTSAAPALAESLRTALQPALTSDFTGPTGRVHADRLAAVTRQLEPVARQQLTALQPQLTQDFALIGKKLLTLADAYDAHAAAVDAAYADFQRQPDLAGKHAAFFARFPIEAEELQSAPRLLEMSFRLVQFLRTLAATEASADWARTEPWHLLELLFMVNGQGGYDKVVYRYDTRYNIRTVQGYTTVGPVVRGFAAQLRVQAGLLQRAVAGQPLDFDFPRFLIENKLSGIPERTKAEFQIAAQLLAKPDATARAAALADLKKAPNAALLAKETAAQKALAQTAQFATPDASRATPATLLPALKSLHSSLADDSGKSTVAELNDALAELEALPEARRTAALPPAWTGRLAALRTAVESELNTRCTALRLPPVSTVSSVNRRDQTAVAKIFWTIRTGMDNFDRRWATRMRDTELMWLRKVHHAAAAAPATDAAARADLALTTAVLGELRARQFGRESRANKGINLLPEDTGPSLNLPPHIAQEFLRARTARPPAAFADRTETYFQKLFNDLKR